MKASTSSIQDRCPTSDLGHPKNRIRKPKKRSSLSDVGRRTSDVEDCARSADVVYIGVGSNKGDRRRNIRKALRLLGAREDIIVEAVSPFYETRPVGGPPGQRDYWNGAVRLRTSLASGRLLATLKRVEAAVGRRPGLRGAAREVDLDILVRGNEVIRKKGLRVPHPRMNSREFVMRPLSDLAPRLRHPVTKKTVAVHLRACRGKKTPRGARIADLL